MKIFINEKPRILKKTTTLFKLKENYKKDADVIIYNGMQVNADYKIKNGDKIVFIKKGEIPSKDELQNLINARHTPGAAERLKKIKIAVAGLGGLGSNAANFLARAGVGTLYLIDFDIVEPSNLNRQQYFTDQLGMFKTEATVINLKRVNPYIKLIPVTKKITSRNAFGILKDAHIIIEAFDKAEEKQMLIKAATEKLKNKYLIIASGLAGFGDNNAIKTRRINKKLFVAGDLKSAACPGRGLMAPRVAIAAAHQANLAVQIALKTLDFY